MDSTSGSDGEENVPSASVTSTLGLSGPLRFRLHGSSQKAHVVLRRVDVDDDRPVVRYSLFAQKRIEVKPGKEILFSLPASDATFQDRPIVLEADLAGGDDDDGNGFRPESPPTGYGIPPKLRRAWVKRFENGASTSYKAPRPFTPLQPVRSSQCVQTDEPPPTPIPSNASVGTQTEHVPEQEREPPGRTRSPSPMELESRCNSPPPSPRSTVQRPKATPRWRRPSNAAVDAARATPSSAAEKGDGMEDNSDQLSSASMNGKILNQSFCASTNGKLINQSSSALSNGSTLKQSSSASANNNILNQSSAAGNVQQGGSVNDSLPSGVAPSSRRAAKRRRKRLLKEGALAAQAAVGRAIHCPIDDAPPSYQSTSKALETVTVNARQGNDPLRVRDAMPPSASTFEDSKHHPVTDVQTTASDSNMHAAESAVATAPSIPPFNHSVILPQPAGPVSFSAVKPIMFEGVNAKAPPPGPRSLSSLTAKSSEDSSSMSTSQSTITATPSKSQLAVNTGDLEPIRKWKTLAEFNDLFRAVQMKQPSSDKAPLSRRNPGVVPLLSTTRAVFPASQPGPNFQLPSIPFSSPPTSTTLAQQSSHVGTTPIQVRNRAVSMSSMFSPEGTSSSSLMLPSLPNAPTPHPNATSFVGASLPTKAPQPDAGLPPRPTMQPNDNIVHMQSRRSLQALKMTPMPATKKVPLTNRQASLTECEERETSVEILLQPPQASKQEESRGTKRSASSEADKDCATRHRTFNWNLMQCDYSTVLQGDGPEVAIRSIAFNSNGSHFAICLSDKTIRIWNSSERIEVAKLAHSVGITSVAWMDGDIGIVFLTEDGTVGKWTRAGWNMWLQGKILDAGKPDGDHLCLAYTRDRIAVSFARTGVKVWIRLKGTWQAQRSIIRRGVTAIRFVAHGDALLGGTRDGALWYCDIPNGTLRAFAVVMQIITCIDVDYTERSALVAYNEGAYVIAMKPTEISYKSEQTISCEELQDQEGLGAVFVGRGQMVLFGCVEGCSLLWNRDTEDVAFALDHGKGEVVQAVANFDHWNESLILTGTKKGKLTWWGLDIQQGIQQEDRSPKRSKIS